MMNQNTAIHEAYPYGLPRRGAEHLTIKTDNHSQQQLASPPASASSRRGSCYDVPFQGSHVSMHHLNMPVHFASAESYSLDPAQELNINIKGLDIDDKYNHLPTPSPNGFTNGSNYAGTAGLCNSPSWQSPLSGPVFDHKVSDEPCFYGNNSSTSGQEWDDSRAKQFETLAAHPGYSLPSQDQYMSFYSEGNSTSLESSQFIAPGQAVNDPAQDYTSHLSFDSDWNQAQSPVPEAMVLQSSSPYETMPGTPSTLDIAMSGYGYEIPPPPSACSSLSIQPPSDAAMRRTQTSKTRLTRKTQKRQSQKEPQALKLVREQGMDVETALKLAPLPPPHLCPTPGCGRHFKRAEHFKRHMGTHSGKHPFECYIAGLGAKECKVGQGKGKLNRKDNWRTHNMTHLKAWMIGYVNNHPEIVRHSERRQRPLKRGRNEPMSPTDMYTHICAKEDDKARHEILEFLNKECGKDFGVHVLWDRLGCPVVPCIGRAGKMGGCTMCRAPKGCKDELKELKCKL